jgi:CRISPR-associated protein Cmr4
MMAPQNRSEKRTYLLLTTDPLHVGTGGYRLGRVDNAIVREPGTNLPKLPGTSISGAIRAYAAYAAANHDPGKVNCAGQGQKTDSHEAHCGEKDGFCPICYSFGYTLPNRARAGVVHFFDARIVCFPVHTMHGPAWVTTADLLADFGLEATGPGEHEGVTTTNPGWSNKPINLGWLLLSVSNTTEVTPTASETHNSLYDITHTVADVWRDGQIPDDVRKALVLVHPTIFSSLVNDNLEVRTSVSIDPVTGAAEEGALFTFEALPRGTLLACDVVEENYRQEPFGPWPDPPWQRPLEVVNTGFQMAELLGFGGMGTRGFGRVRVLNL